MSRNGSGTYSLPAGNPVVTGTTISSSWANTTLSDIANALTGSVASDGQTPMTGNLQMGSNKITGLAAGTVSTDAVNLGQLTGGTTAGVFTSVTDSGLTSGRVTYATTGGLLTDSANMTFDGTKLTLNALSFAYNTSYYNQDNTISNYSATNAFYISGNSAGSLYLQGAGNQKQFIDIAGTSTGGNIAFGTNGLEKMRLDSSGNLGLGVTPSAWGSTFDSFELGTIGNFITGYVGAARLEIGANAYYNGTSWTYANTAAATRFTQISGEYRWYNAPSGTAGNAITFTQAMTLDASGILSVSNNSNWGIRLTGSTGGLTGSLYADGSAFGIAASTSDINNAIYVTSSNTAIFRTNGSERMRISSSGNLLVGTTTDDGYKLKVVGGNAANFLVDNGGQQYTQLLLQRNGTGNTGGDILIDGTASTMNFRGLLAGAMTFQTSSSAGSPTERMRIDTSGNVGIGTSSPKSNSGYTTLTLNNASNGGVLEFTNNGTTINQIYNDASGAYIATASGKYLQLNAGGSTYISASTNGTERARIDSSGNLLVGSTGGNGLLTTYGSNNDIQKVYSTQASSSSFTFISMWSGSTTPSAPTGTLRVNILTNGGIANYQANNSNLSDERTKTDIQLAGNYLDKICSIPVKTFKYKDQTDDLLNLGVIAQDVEAVAPELVDVSGFGETPEDGVPLKAIYQTDLQYALMKAIQELKAEVDSLKAQLNK